MTETAPGYWAQRLPPDADHLRHLQQAVPATLATYGSGMDNLGMLEPRFLASITVHLKFLSAVKP